MNPPRSLGLRTYFPAPARIFGFGQQHGDPFRTILNTLAQRGDFADTMQALSFFGSSMLRTALPPNVGMGSQFSENTYYTNKGSSSYNGLLITLHKNAGYGLQFDLNYTWSHSIDNVSLVANRRPLAATASSATCCGRGNAVPTPTLT